MKPELKRVASRQGGVFSRDQAMNAGYSPEQIRERLAAGRWERLRRGQYTEHVELDALPPWERAVHHHRRLIHAAVNSMRAGSAVVSHYSALVLHGIPVWDVDLTEVQLTRTTTERCGRKAGVRHHQAELTPADVTEIEDVAVTSAARAVVETASTASLETAVVSADAAFRRPDVTSAELRRLLAVTECWPGGPSIRFAVAFANPLAESVGESLLRVLMHNEGLPQPVLQAVFHDDQGLIGRVDFYFPEYDTIVEFDGMIKYGAGSTESLIREKLREDRLRELGLQIVRIKWEDLQHPARTAMRIRKAFARARRTTIAS
ncbi:type IV toxin-antitoxin system AbiEi family antitoxin domain-containing protein [Kribbella sp. NPDC048915]|uniref:type IV toxin-antitoxin system AbiEi family antitoxin domain-containing protein n=1 Tax=Kribbella sp. NPDC048915 TaxID=3155148 RepID=UPI0033F35DAF